MITGRISLCQNGTNAKNVNMILNFKVLVTIFYFLYIHFWVGFSFGLSQIDGVPGHIGRKGVHRVKQPTKTY